MTFNDSAWGEPLTQFLQRVPKSTTLLRGIDYAATGMVRDLWLDGDRSVAAIVLGSSDIDYSTYLTIHGTTLATKCSCPVEYDCKHSVAVALVVLAEAARRDQEWTAVAQASLPDLWLRVGAGIGFTLRAQLDLMFGTSPSTQGGKRASETAPEPAEWWRRYAETGNQQKRLGILKQVAQPLFKDSGRSWYIQERLRTMTQKANAIESLRAFRTWLQEAVRHHPKLMMDLSGLDAFLESDEARLAEAQTAARLAEDMFVSWLKPTRKSMGGVPAHIEIVWSTASTGALDLPCLYYTVLLTTGKLHRQARHGTAIAQLHSECERGKRSLQPQEYRFLAWLTSYNNASNPQNPTQTTRDRDSTLIVVRDILSWISLWGDSGLLSWENGEPVGFHPEPARLTIQNTEDGPMWAVAFPGDEGNAQFLRNVDVCREAPIDPYRREFGYEAHSAYEALEYRKVFVRREGVIYRLDTGAMPGDIVAAARTMGRVPMKRLRRNQAGARLIQLLPPASCSTLVSEVPVTPVVELRYEDGQVSVAVKANTLDGREVFRRTASGDWELEPHSAASTDLEAVEGPQAEGPKPVVSSREASLDALATRPRREDVEALEAWLRQFVPPLACSEPLPNGAPAMVWKHKSGESGRLIEAWHRRPPHVEYLGNKAFLNLVRTLHPPKFNVKIESSGIDWLTVSVELESEMSELSIEEAIKALETTESELIVLPGGRVFRRDELEEYRRNILALGGAGLEIGAAHQRIHALQLAGGAGDALEDLGASDERLRELARKARTLAQSFQGIPAAPLNDHTAHFLRPYQRQGVDFLVWAAQTLGGALLADDMGLGKTLQVLAALTSLRSQVVDPRPSLVVCPASVAHNWARETRRFTPELRVAVLESGSERMNILGRLDDYDVVIKNYALTRRDADILKEHKWFMVCIDEAQAIKNPKADITRVVKSLDVQYRFALTGTPIENRLTDLWSIVDFALPAFLGSLAHFEARAKEADSSVVNRILRSRLRPVLMRRLKAEVAPELPPRIEERRDCSMTPSQRKIYLAEVQRTRALLETATGRNVVGKERIQILAALTRLRQICCDPGLLNLKASGSGKVDELMDLLPALLEGGHKVLLFSQFVRMLERLQSILDARGILTRMLTGATTRRQELVDAFESDPTPSVFLISLKAGGTGLNLVSATHVVLFDPWWNPAVEAQAIDRTHRIGQDKTVVAFRLITRGTVEERIAELQERKREMVSQLLEEESFNRSLTREDFEYLLAGGDD